MWFIYVLLCEGGTLYTGYTDDVDRRFLVHQSGKGGKYTRSHKPVSVLYREPCTTKSEAMKREHEIKRWDRAKKISVLKLSLPSDKIQSNATKIN